MDYDDIFNNYKEFCDWNVTEGYDSDNFFDNYKAKPKVPDFVTFGAPVKHPEDKVNHPSHYTKGKAEAIEVIEDAIDDAPTMQTALNHAQALKYLLRLWLKDNPVEDAKKARWYLNRLIDHLEGNIE